jgi:hypothetical protein
VLVVGGVGDADAAMPMLRAAVCFNYESRISKIM